MGKLSKANKSKSSKQKLQKKLKTKNPSKVNQFKATTKFEQNKLKNKNEPSMSDTTPVENTAKNQNKRKNSQTEHKTNFKRQKIIPFGGTTLLSSNSNTPSINKNDTKNNTTATENNVAASEKITKKMKKKNKKAANLNTEKNTNKSIAENSTGSTKTETAKSKNSTSKTKRQKRRTKMKKFKQRFNEMRKKIATGGKEAEEIVTKLKTIVEDENTSTDLLISVNCAKQLLYFHKNGKDGDAGEKKVLKNKLKTGKKKDVDSEKKANTNNPENKQNNVNIKQKESNIQQKTKNANENNGNKNEQKSPNTKNKNKSEVKHVLFVGNLPFECTSADLKRYFSEVCVVKHIRMPLQKGTNKSKGIAYVEVDSDESLQKGLSLHHSEIQNRKINVLKSDADRKKNKADGKQKDP